MVPQNFITVTQGVRNRLLEIVEIFLAVLVFCAVAYFSWNSLQSFLWKDWSSASVMYEFISVILLILLALEVTRLILVHSLTVVMELMMLILARKMLYPEIAALELLYCAVAFALVIGVYYLYELKPLKSLDDLTQ